MSSRSSKSTPANDSVVSTALDMGKRKLDFTETSPYVKKVKNFDNLCPSVPVAAEKDKEITFVYIKGNGDLFAFFVRNSRSIRTICDSTPRSSDGVDGEFFIHSFIYLLLL